MRVGVLAICLGIAQRRGKAKGTKARGKGLGFNLRPRRAKARGSPKGVVRPRGKREVSRKADLWDFRKFHRGSRRELKRAKGKTNGGDTRVGVDGDNTN